MGNFETNKTHPNVEWRPWDYSTGPKSLKGKNKASRNSHRHGFYCDIFRDYRRHRRQSDTINFEWQCLDLIRKSDQGRYFELEGIIDDLRVFTMKTWEAIRDEALSPQQALEFRYISALFEKTLRYSLSVVIHQINSFWSEQHGN